YRDLARSMPGAKKAPEALFRAAWLEWNRSRPKAAIAGLTTFLAKFPKSAFADDARWFLAHSRLEAGDLSGADADLGRLAAKGQGALGRGKFLYWRARIAERRRDKRSARSLYRTVATEYPLSYYALLSTERLSELGEKVWPTPGNAAPPTP